MSATTLNTDETYLSIGAELRARREENGLSLSDIAASLNIQTPYLMAIENLDKQNLPSLGYVLGFVRTYARHLKMDASEAVARFKNDIECPDNLGMRDCPHHVPKRNFRIPKGSLAIGLVLIFALAMVTWYGTQSNASSERSVNAPLTVAIQTENIDAQLASMSADTITLKAIGPSWVEVKDAGGMVLFSRIMVPGEVFEMNKSDGPLLSLRDAGAIELYIGAKRIGAIGQSGEAAANIPLATAAQ